MAFTDQTFEAHMGYAPWLRSLVDDMSLAYLSGTRKLNKRQAVGMALRYFSLGNITFTDVNGTAIRDFSPNEFSLDFGFSQKFGDKFSGGFTARYIHSNLTGGTNILGADSRPGRSVAVDVGVFHTNDNVKFGDRDGRMNWGVCVSNVGAKMSYTETAERDFIPTNLEDRLRRHRLPRRLQPPHLHHGRQQAPGPHGTSLRRRRRRRHHRQRI